MSCSRAARGTSCRTAVPGARPARVEGATAAAPCETRRRACLLCRDPIECGNCGRRALHCGTRRSPFRDRTTPARGTARNSPGESASGFRSCDSRRRTDARGSRRTSGIRWLPPLRERCESSRYAHVRMPVSAELCPGPLARVVSPFARAQAAVAIARLLHRPVPARASGAARRTHRCQGGTSYRLVARGRRHSVRSLLARRRRGFARSPPPDGRPATDTKRRDSPRSLPPGHRDLTRR